MPRDRRIQIIAPSVRFPAYESLLTSKSLSLPKNNPFMPMQEGAAIARLMVALRTVDPVCSIDVATSVDYRYDYGLTFCIGGPAVNSSSQLLLLRHLPDLSFTDAVVAGRDDSATINGRLYTPRFDRAGDIIEDYGVMLYVRDKDSKSIVFLAVGLMGLKWP